MADQKQYDAEQERMMAEECILLDENDNAVGHATKRVCHDVKNVLEGDKLLHRAFSVFLFNTKGELLLQQRADEKITFPGRWTNTCCSHPLWRDEERIEENALGVKNAAIRKLDHEMGISVGTIKPEDIHFLTRLHYQAPCHGKWIEHEIDYVLFIQKDVELNLNANEVKAVKYVDAKGLQQMFDEREAKSTLISPWFEIICNNFFFGWWKDLDTIMKNKGLNDEKVTKTIHRLKLE